jgi:hypothetical protein
MSGDIVGVDSANKTGTEQGKFHHNVHLFAHLQDGLIIRPQLLDVDVHINPATILLMGRNGGVDKLHPQHTILNCGKQVGQWVGFSPIATGESGVGNIRIKIGECL